MNKENCIVDYFSATKAYYLYLLGSFYNEEDYKIYITDKKNLCGAKLSFISNIMLSIKEDLVDNKGSLNYESNLFVDSLEKLVDLIAKRDKNGYLLDNYLFKDAATLVSTLRNKLAHGKYIIDFENNKIIIDVLGNSININVDKLVEFMMMSFKAVTMDKKTNHYEREVLIFKNKDVNRKKPLNTKAQLKSLVRGFRAITFSLSSLDDSIIDKECIKYLDLFIRYYDINPDKALSSDYYKELNKYLKRNNCFLNITSSSIRSEDDVLEIVESLLADKYYMGIEDIDYEKQIELIGLFVFRRIKNKYNMMDPLIANFNNLILLRAIEKTDSYNYNKVSKYITDNYSTDLKIKCDELGMALISMFNSLFIYPNEDVYTTSGGYKLDRNDEFDFSLLDLGMVNPSVINVSDSFVQEAFTKYNALLKEKDEKENKLLEKNNDLAVVTKKNNSKAIANISNVITGLQGTVNLLNTECQKAKDIYDSVLDDYNNNFMYFRNKAIIEGIRNSIAHGHYEFINSSNMMDTKIIFSDIYNGEVTFKTELTFYQFEQLILNNFDIILNSFFYDKGIMKRK